jgi:hypothetical protein|tara:strand:- start:194 stop:595 length:402 start_codon:yes stop_codon:yes gene_type:complete
MPLNDSNDINELKKFDIDLAFGKHWEQYIDDMFSGAKTCEVKTERNKWAQTGNICIESESYGKPSGIKATEADMWVHNLTVDNELVCSLVFPVEKLKEILPKLPQRSVMGGDNNASKLQLVSLVKLMETIKDL